MEAGRSVLRGLVTPDKHDADRLDPPLARGGREAGAGRRRRRSRTSLSIATEFAARRTIAFDMEKLAKAQRQRDLGGDVRRARGGRGAAVSARGVRGDDPRRRHAASSRALRAFAAAFDQAQTRADRADAPAARKALRRTGRRRRATPSSTGSARASSDFPRRRSRCSRPARAGWSIISTRPMRANISTGSQRSSTPTGATAARRGLRLHRRRREISRGRDGL